MRTTRSTAKPSPVEPVQFMYHAAYYSDRTTIWDFPQIGGEYQGIPVNLPLKISWKFRFIGIVAVYTDVPSRELTYPIKNHSCLKMIFLFPRWDMLIRWRVLYLNAPLFFLPWTLFFTRKQPYLAPTSSQNDFSCLTIFLQGKNKLLEAGDCPNTVDGSEIPNKHLECIKPRTL